MATPSPSWAMSPLPSGTGHFSQNRSQSFQKGSSLLQSNFLSEQEPIIPEQEPIISEQEPITTE